MGGHCSIEPTALAPHQVVVDMQQMAGARRTSHHLDNLRGARILTNTWPLNTPLTPTPEPMACERPALVAAVAVAVPQPPPLVPPFLREARS